jgi:hypothetical protein
MEVEVDMELVVKCCVHDYRGTCCWDRCIIQNVGRIVELYNDEDNGSLTERVNITAKGDMQPARFNSQPFDSLIYLFYVYIIIISSSSSSIYYCYIYSICIVKFLFNYLILNHFKYTCIIFKHPCSFIMLAYIGVRYISTLQSHILLENAPNLGPLISRWEIIKFNDC